MEGWQRAFVIHARPYSETSLLLDFFTEMKGECAYCQKVRGRRSPKRSSSTFTPLLIRWSGRGEIKSSVMLSLSL